MLKEKINFDIVKEEKWLTDCIIRITDIGVPEYKEEDGEMFI